MKIAHIDQRLTGSPQHYIVNTKEGRAAFYSPVFAARTPEDRTVCLNFDFYFSPRGELIKKEIGIAAPPDLQDETPEGSVVDDKAAELAFHYSRKVENDDAFIDVETPCRDCQGDPDEDLKETRQALQMFGYSQPPIRSICQMAAELLHFQAMRSLHECNATLTASSPALHPESQAECEMARQVLNTLPEDLADDLELICIEDA